MTDPLLTVVDDAVPPPLFRKVRDGVVGVGRAATYWKTFWFPLGEAACLPEALALALRPHVPLERVAGVEWWLGRMRTTNVLLDFHHDRDLALFERTGRLAHPAWSSVLFLNRTVGGSLFVTDQKLVRRGDELRLSPAEPRDHATVRPAPNRFVLFPGNLLHGVLDADDRVPTRRLPRREGDERWSVVLNWWTRRPLEVPQWRETRRYRSLATR
jgi:hypothetical protein